VYATGKWTGHNRQRKISPLMNGLISFPELSVSEREIAEIWKGTDEFPTRKKLENM
jgi:hypothetical protein